MRVGVLLLVLGVVGACDLKDYGPTRCYRWPGANALPHGAPCPSEVELRENCPKLCDDPTATDCTCQSADASLAFAATVVCITTMCDG
jgi:hypothetical protein